MFNVPILLCCGVMRTRATLAMALGLLGCGGAPELAQSGVTTTEPQAQPDSSASAVAEASAAGPYALHEWGLLSADYGSDQVPALAGALPVVVQLRMPDLAEPPRGYGGGPRDILNIDLDVGSVDKPVVYFHLDSGTDALRLAFSVAPAGDGRVLEHFPPGVLGPEGRQLRYDDVRLTRGDCTGAYPAPSDAPCDTADGVCEVRELARYETTDADCVHVGDTAGGFLFYRTGPARATLPLSVSVENPTAVRVTQLAATDASAPRVRGWVMRVYRPWQRSATLARMVSLNDADSVVLDRAGGEGALGADAAEAQLSASLVEAGLTPAERDAFMRAWRVPLFGAPDERVAPGESEDFGADRALGIGMIGVSVDDMARALGAAEDSLLYILPRASVDALLPLTLQPVPRTSRRVFVVRVNLRDTRPVHLAVYRPRVQGPVSADVGRSVVRGHLAMFGACAGWGTTVTEAALAIRIERTGVVDSVSVSGTSLPPEMVTCLSNAASSITFPAMPTVGVLYVTLSATRPRY